MRESTGIPKWLLAVTVTHAHLMTQQMEKVLVFKEMATRATTRVLSVPTQMAKEAMAVSIKMGITSGIIIASNPTIAIIMGAGTTGDRSIKVAPTISSFIINTKANTTIVTRIFCLQFFANSSVP